MYSYTGDPDVSDEDEAQLCAVIMEACALAATECPGLSVTVDALVSQAVADGVAKRLAKRGYTSGAAFAEMPLERHYALRKADPYADDALLVRCTSDGLAGIDLWDLTQRTAGGGRRTYLVANVSAPRADRYASLVASNLGSSLLRLVRHYIAHRVEPAPRTLVRLCAEADRQPWEYDGWFHDVYAYFIAGDKRQVLLAPTGIKTVGHDRKIEARFLRPEDFEVAVASDVDNSDDLLVIDVFDRSAGRTKDELIAEYMLRLGQAVESPIQFPLNPSTQALCHHVPTMPNSLFSSDKIAVGQCDIPKNLLAPVLHHSRLIAFLCSASRCYGGDDPLFGEPSSTEALRCVIKQLWYSRVASDWTLRVVYLPREAGDPPWQAALQARLRRGDNEVLFVLDARHSGGINIQSGQDIIWAGIIKCNPCVPVSRVLMAGLCGVRMAPWPLDTWPARLACRAVDPDRFEHQFVLVLRVPDDPEAVRSLLQAWDHESQAYEVPLKVFLRRGDALPGVREACDQLKDRWLSWLTTFSFAEPSATALDGPWRGTALVLEPDATEYGFWPDPGLGFAERPVRFHPWVHELMRAAFLLKYFAEENFTD